MRTKHCLDEAAIQAYLDGELSSDLMGAAARHTAECAACGEALAAASEELSFFATAFAPAADVSVPTERLRARIDEAVAAFEPASPAPKKGSGWTLGALVGWLSAPASFAPRHAASFAGLLALLALAALFAVIYLQRPGTDMAGKGSDREVAVTSGGGKEEKPTPAPESEKKEQPTPESGTPAPKQEKPATQPRKLPRVVRDTLEPRREEVAQAPNTDNLMPDVADGGPKQQRFVPGEERYLRAVASLEAMIEVGGDAALRPSVRTDYERNLAVINQAIADTRRAALRNPKDADAASYLFSSYQTKIELMRSVADQAQVATLGQ